jgi:hypothetical protein
VKVYGKQDVWMHLHIGSENDELLVLAYSRFTYCDGVGLAYLTLGSVGLTVGLDVKCKAKALLLAGK